MAQVTANGINIEYEEYGDKNDPAVLFIGGWSVQLIFWPKPLIEAVVAAGFRVIVFDNRDVGHSRKINWFPATSPFAAHVLLARFFRSRRLTAYTLEDMAEDAVGVLDALEIEKAHILGLSMGGMITQILAGKYPERVLSATILMSSTNRVGLPLPPLALAARVLINPRFRSRSGQKKRSEDIWRRIRTIDGGYDETDFRQGITSTIDRAYAPSGRRRQLEAVIATGDLRVWTRKILAPTLIIHGSQDLLSPPAGGEDIADCISHSEFRLIEGMGHDLPPKHLPEICKLVSEHLSSASMDIQLETV